MQLQIVNCLLLHYRGNEGAAGQLRPLRHHIYRGAVVGVRGAAVGARGAVVGVRGAAVGNIGMHTYIRHICAPVHVLQQYMGKFTSSNLLF